MPLVSLMLAIYLAGKRLVPFDAAVLTLLGTMDSGLAPAFRNESHREAAIITFLVTLPGVVAGALAMFVQQYGQARRAPLAAPADSPPTLKL